MPKKPTQSQGILRLFTAKETLMGSSPRTSSNSTCSVVVVIYGWECAVIKLQLPQRPSDILGTLTVRPRQRPCCGHLDSHGCGDTCQMLSVWSAPLTQMTWLLSLTENGTVACLADKPPRSTVIMLGYCVSAASHPLCQNILASTLNCHWIQSWQPWLPQSGN